MNIFITGITGFVGSGLVNYFRSQEDIIVNGHSRDADKAKLQLGGFPVIHHEHSTSVLDRLKIDVVIHLAGIAHDLSNVYGDEDYDKVNAQNTMRAFDTFLHSNAKKFIFLSSIKAVVDVAETPIEETVLPAPVTAYGKSKLKAEQYILTKQLPADKRIYIFRPAMIHGPGNKGNLNLLYKFVKSGLPWPLGKFHNQRSFLSSDNFNAVIDHFIYHDVLSGIYHLADTGYISTNELVSLIGGAMNRPTRRINVPPFFVKAITGITGQQSRISKLTENMMVSNKKLMSVLDKPLPRTLQEGIIKTIRSFDE